MEITGENDERAIDDIGWKQPAVSGILCIASFDVAAGRIHERDTWVFQYAGKNDTGLSTDPNGCGVR